MDFASALAIGGKHRYASIGVDQALTLEGVAFDLWWPKEEVMKKENLDVTKVIEITTSPMTVIAVSAPALPRNETSWFSDSVLMTTIRKV